MNAQPGHIAHGKAPELFQPGRKSPAHPPEVRDRFMAPEQFPVFHFIQIRDPHAVLIRRHMLGHNVHGDFRQVHIGADPGRRRDSGGLKHIADHGLRQLPRRLAVCLQISRHIHEHLINGIDMDILRTDVFHVNGKDLRAVLLVQFHPRRRGEVRHFIIRMGLQGRIINGRGCESILPVLSLMNPPGPDPIPEAFRIDLLHALHDLKQPGASGNTV